MTTVRICESCEHGYAPLAISCPYCSCSDQMSYTIERPIYMMDIECYRDYFLIKFKRRGYDEFIEFNLFAGSKPLDVPAIQKLLSTVTIVTFNGNGYDVPMMTLACSGATNDQLKQASDAIIQQNLRNWQFYSAFNLQQPEWIQHIDLIEVSPGVASLKAYGGKMHSRKIQDLPFNPAASIAWHDRVALREYCGNDLQTTEDLYDTLIEQIKLRTDMTAQYGIDLRSKSDAQIAEAILKAQLGFKVERPNIPAGTAIRYNTPAWLAFQTPLLQDVLATVQDALFIIGTNGSPALPPSLATLDIHIGGTEYTLQIGGLHSCEKSVSHYATDTMRIIDADVASYYPNLIRNMQLHPMQIGPAFNDIYSGWIDRRIAAKRAGDKKVADSLKTLVNGTFGKTGSVWSILYAPDLMLAVTLGGQLSLFMLIEQLELSGLRVVSANTDGVVIMCPRHLEWLMQDIFNWWQAATNLELETTDYSSIHSRDINNYIALKPDGTAKLKGAYAPPKIIGPSWPNPTTEICNDAVVAYLRDGTPLADTIRTCQDVRLFVSIRAVKGGGEWVRRIGPPVVALVRAKREVLTAAGWLPHAGVKPATWFHPDVNVAHTLDAAYASLITETDVVYLGKVVRWYYAAADGGYSQIRYVASKNLVADTEGSRPMMELTDTLPDDIDYARYVQIAQNILTDVGVTYEYV
jgi:hypothetical protein